MQYWNISISTNGGQKPEVVMTVIFNDQNVTNYQDVHTRPRRTVEQHNFITYRKIQHDGKQE